MADVPKRISALTTQLGLLPNPAAGYKVAIEKSTDTSAKGIDLTALAGGFSALRTIDEYYAITDWNMQHFPQYIHPGHSTPGITLVDASVPTTVDGAALGTIIAVQAVSVLDSQGILHDAHGMHDDAFNKCIKCGYYLVWQFACCRRAFRDRRNVFIFAVCIPDTIFTPYGGSCLCYDSESRSLGNPH